MPTFIASVHVLPFKRTRRLDQVWMAGTRAASVATAPPGHDSSQVKRDS